MYLSGIIAGLFNMFVNPIALQSIGWKYYFVYIVFLIAFLVISYFFYPETRGHTLEQVAFIFDGEQAEMLPADSKDEVLVEQKSV